MADKIEVLGVKFDNVSLSEAFERACAYFQSPNEAHSIFTPNPEIVMHAYNDEGFLNILNSASLVIPDGIGVIYASRILKTPLKERTAGFDLALRLIEYCAGAGHGIYLLGAKPGVALKAAERLSAKHPSIKIAGVRDGYFTENEGARIVDDINGSGAKLLLVCLGAPKQEKWIYDNKDKLKGIICMGAGGVLDVLAGDVKRAPDIFIKLNLEWFYRLMKQPSRIGRYASIPKFLAAVMKSRRRLK